jgi:hypothetical protein
VLGNVSQTGPGQIIEKIRFCARTQFIRDKETNLTMYTAYDMAQHILQIRNYTQLSVNGFAELPTEVLSAILHQTAEWRNVEEMETLIKIGANPHETHEGFTVLENFIQGHDGYWICKDRVKEVEDGVKMLSKYGVTDNDLSHRWILKNCDEIIKNSEYLITFFKVDTNRVKLYYHLPGAGELTLMERTFDTVDEVVKSLTCLTNHRQYVAIIEDQGTVTRYLVSKGCGIMDIVPMENKPGWTEKQSMLSNIVNFVMANEEMPTLPCEEDEDEDEDM